MAGTFSPPLQPGTRYRVYVTPRTGTYTYGTQVEVTDHITFDGVNEIKRAIDSQDYEIGIYFYSDLQLIGSNDNGYFNDASDLRSIFSPFSRDLAKVTVVFENTDGDTIMYYGLIQDQATRVDAINETVTFRVLSLDSIIGTTQVAGGTVADGVSVKTAILSLLNQAAIASVLTASEANINPNNNFTIDIGDAFDETETQDSLNQLLACSNSVMKITSAGVVSVVPRAPSTVSSLNLYGPFDELRRQNVITIQNYNVGLQRMFNSVQITDGSGALTTFDNIPMIEAYGFNQAQLEFDFLLDPSNIAIVGKVLLAEFCTPKVEMEVQVPTRIASSVDLLDPVSVNWPLRITSYQGKMMPVIGTAIIGNANFPLPNKNGSLYILPNVAFKVIEIDHDPSSFTSILKLRQIGTTVSDGYFNQPASSIVGFGVVGAALIGGTGSTDAQWNPSVVGAARVGSTVLQ